MCYVVATFNIPYEILMGAPVTLRWTEADELRRTLRVSLEPRTNPNSPFSKIDVEHSTWRSSCADTKGFEYYTAAEVRYPAPCGVKAQVCDPLDDKAADVIDRLAREVPHQALEVLNVVLGVMRAITGQAHIRTLSPCDVWHWTWRVVEGIDGANPTTMTMFFPATRIESEPGGSGLDVVADNICAKLSSGWSPSVSLELLLNARSHLSVGDYRLAVMEAFISIETHMMELAWALASEQSPSTSRRISKLGLRKLRSRLREKHGLVLAKTTDDELDRSYVLRCDVVHGRTQGAQITRDDAADALALCQRIRAELDPWSKKAS